MTTAHMFFYSGPEGYFYADSLKDGEKIMKLMNVDSSEWTATKVTVDSIKRAIEIINGAPK